MLHVILFWLSTWRLCASTSSACHGTKEFGIGNVDKPSAAHFVNLDLFGVDIDDNDSTSYM